MSAPSGAARAPRQVVSEGFASSAALPAGVPWGASAQGGEAREPRYRRGRRGAYRRGDAPPVVRTVRRALRAEGSGPAAEPGPAATDASWLRFSAAATRFQQRRSLTPVLSRNHEVETRTRRAEHLAFKRRRVAKDAARRAVIDPESWPGSWPPRPVPGAGPAESEFDELMDQRGRETVWDDTKPSGQNRWCTGCHFRDIDGGHR